MLEQCLGIAHLFVCFTFDVPLGTCPVRTRLFVDLIVWCFGVSGAFMFESLFMLDWLRCLNWLFEAGYCWLQILFTLLSFLCYCSCFAVY